MKKPNWRPVPQDDDDVPPFEPSTSRVTRAAESNGAAVRPDKQESKAAAPAKGKSTPARAERRSTDKPNKAAKPAAKKTTGKKPSSKSDAEPEVIVLHESESGKTRHVLYMSTYEGLQLVSVRQQYLDQETGEWRFGKNGVSIPFERSVLVRMSRGAKQLAEKLDDK